MHLSAPTRGPWAESGAGKWLGSGRKRSLVRHVLKNPGCSHCPVGIWWPTPLEYTLRAGKQHQ